MKICAVICEYDPFHNGHRYQIQKLKAEGYTVISIMSGSFTERGNAALISKYDRATAAVVCGSDLVLELPFPFCSLSAPKFAYAGVSLSDKLGCVDTLAFGSECGCTGDIVTAAENLISREFNFAVSENTGAGKRYYDTVREQYEKMFGKSDLFSGSNDLLGVEYVKSLLLRKSKIKPYAVKRVGRDFNDIESGGFASSSGIRKMLASGDINGIKEDVPEISFELLLKAQSEGLLADAERLFLPYAAILRLASPENISCCAETNAELAGRICAFSKQAKSLEELIALSVTRIYSPSRIKRALLFSVLGIKNKMAKEPVFTVVLAASRAGRSLINEIKKKNNIAVITKQADYIKESEEVRAAYEMSSRAEALWTLALGKPQREAYNLLRAPFMKG